VAWLPGAQAFLERVRQMGKRLVLITNAHPEALRIKDERTGVTRYFSAVFSSHQFGFPKEDAAFWEALHRVEPFDRERTMFVDDSAAVLRAGKKAGIKWIYAVRRAQSRDPWEEAEFSAIDSVAQL
jgi:5'-nucleotidase